MMLLAIFAMFSTGAQAQVIDPARYAVPSPYRIPASAGQGTVRYRIRLPETGWFVPDTAEQRVESDGRDLLVTVCDDCGREAPPPAAELQRQRQPNAWVQSGDHAVRQLARAAGGGLLDTRMRRLVEAVRLRLDGPTDYSRYATAREAYDQRRGDCTEYAVLLAALARAAGYPARIAVGIAYGSRFVGVRHAFGPHAWVQVWDGDRWKSYDAGLPAFDARHIALAVGDGTPAAFRGVLPLIERMDMIEVARIVE